MPLPATNSAHFMIGPLIAMVVLVGLALLLRWTYGPQRRTTLADREAARRGHGLLVPVVTVERPSEATEVRDLLAGSGIRATVGRAPDGAIAVLVFPADEARARSALERRTP